MVGMDWRQQQQSFAGLPRVGRRPGERQGTKIGKRRNYYGVSPPPAWAVVDYGKHSRPSGFVRRGIVVFAVV